MPSGMFKMLLILVVTVSGCSSKNESTVNTTVENANRLMSDNGNCARVVTMLEDLGIQNRHTHYLQTLAAAYACVANFNTIVFFNDFLDSIATNDADALLSSLAAMDTSDDMTSADDPDYINMQRGIDLLLYAGDIDIVSHQERSNVFGERIADNMDIQNLYMVLTQLGRWLAYYGNTDDNGVKGSGPETNTCLIDYMDIASQALINIPPGSTGNCTSTTSGHPDLAGNRERRCQGIVLFNNFLDLLGNVSIARNTNTEDIDDLTGLTTVLQSNCNNAGLGAICTVRIASVCENDPSITDQTIELYYASTLERLL